MRSRLVLRRVRPKYGPSTGTEGFDVVSPWRGRPPLSTDWVGLSGAVVQPMSQARGGNASAGELRLYSSRAGQLSRKGY